jgi:DNA-binding IclR family transcriptional regulator
LGTVSKALQLLDLFSRQRPVIGLSDIARLSGMNKATCFRMLTELQQHGFVEQAGAAREYRLGPQVLRLASLREAAVPLRDAAQPVLQRLAGLTQETVHMSVIIGESLRLLAFAYGSGHSMAVRMEDTDTLPYHATSSGLAVMAFSRPALARRVLSGPLPRLTDRTVTDPDTLLDRLADIRMQGFAGSEGGFEAEVSSLAFPLFDAAGQCSGALAVAAPALRMTGALRMTIRREGTAAARQVTGLWGGQVPPEVAALWATAPADMEKA